MYCLLLYCLIKCIKCYCIDLFWACHFALNGVGRCERKKIWQFICKYICCASTTKGKFHRGYLLCIHSQRQIPSVGGIRCVIHNQRKISSAKLYVVNPQPKANSICGDIYIYIMKTLLWVLWYYRWLFWKIDTLKCCLIAIILWNIINSDLLTLCNGLFVIELTPSVIA